MCESSHLAVNKSQRAIGKQKHQDTNTTTQPGDTRARATWQQRCSKLRKDRCMFHKGRLSNTSETARSNVPCCRRPGPAGTMYLLSPYAVIQLTMLR
jgi:hypothetical protein